MRGQLRDERDRAVHPCDDRAVAGLNVGTDELDQPRQGVGRFARLQTMWLERGENTGQTELPILPGPGKVPHPTLPTRAQGADRLAM
ncbi:MAG: hypothetical protein NVSMB18_26380 [Acetobacteraceae bacterium]